MKMRKQPERNPVIADRLTHRSHRMADPSHAHAPEDAPADLQLGQGHEFRNEGAGHE
jgi:hypothetical protein